jgi:hypothetical protein
VSRVFFAGNRLYVLDATADSGDFDQQLYLLNSFRVLPKDEYVAVLISENTPASLPQSPKILRPSSDTHENGLKGHVMSVTTYSQEKGRESRYISTQENYDGSGYLVFEIMYMRGYPTDLTKWGWIDGKRVSDSKNVEYGTSEGPNEHGTIMITGLSVDDEKRPKLPRDDRFSYRYEYKYNSNGQITDWYMFQNDGTLWQHRTYVDSPGKREETTFDENGKVNYRSVYRLDRTGNVQEETSYDYDGKLSGVTVYSYQFDGAGNWITKRQFEKVKQKGRFILKPSYIEDRKIIYY